MSWLVGAVGLTGFYFSGKKVWWSWYINLACQVLWIVFALVTGYLAFLVTAAAYSIIFGVNAYRWTEEHFRIKRWIREEEEAMGWKQSRGRHLTAEELEEVFPTESNLVLHARNELERIGEDQDVIDWYVRVIDEYRSFGHSGGSHMAIMPTLIKLLNFEPLQPLTNDPAEWHFHGSEIWGEEGGIWQNKRDGRMFSSDAGLTFTNVDDPRDAEDNRTVYVSQVVTA